MQSGLNITNVRSMDSIAPWGEVGCGRDAGENADATSLRTPPPAHNASRGASRLERAAAAAYLPAPVAVGDPPTTRPLSMRLHALQRRRIAIVAAMAASIAVPPEPAAATDLPPDVVASFTHRVQPLVLNRCAAGACHGGPDSPAPRFRRAAVGAQPDRQHTRANLAALLEAVGPARDPRPLAALLAAGHPTQGGTSSRRASAFTTAERVTLDRWLADVRAAERLAAPVDRGVVPVAAEVAIDEPAPPRPNRFRELLDAAANPPALPPPQEPSGVIFKPDSPE